MRVVVTGSSGHLGEGLVRTLRRRGSAPSPTGRSCAASGADSVVPTATLHKPHIVTHSRQAFIETNVLGTLNLLGGSPADENIKANEYLHRRVDLGDAVEAHLAALRRAEAIRFGCYIVSATSPFTPEHLAGIREDAAATVSRLFPSFAETYARRGWRMFPSIDRVYVNEKARRELGWRPRIDFGEILGRLGRDEDVRSPLAREVGAKGYHDRTFREGPYPVHESD